MELESSQSYANFRAWCPRKEVSVGVLHPIPWKYYEWGPKAYPEPVVFLHSLIGSAESFYQQIISLAPRGYRVISIQIPVYWTVAEFCDAFHSFLETISHQKLHLYGAGLGGFLAMQYAVRKPDQVASLVLTHSFLATDNLNLRIPYSAGVLRWLPDFLVRGTMRAILPKGRVSLDMANAAELAIGQTMVCSREVLASRMALSVTSSTVVKRIHIPETSITLIDTLDRLPAALELSERTAAELPNARRAFLKVGGDFPYLSVPDDINVHLVVHLRRNAVDPVADVPVPVPARPRKFPAKTRHRVNSDLRGSDGSQTNDERPPKSEKKQRRSSEEILQAARALVAADERSRIEKYTFEIGRLRDFLPARNDAYLGAVIEHCDGNLDLAISNALEEQYDEEFYEEVLKAAINKAVDDLRKVEDHNEDLEDEDIQGRSDGEGMPNESQDAGFIEEGRANSGDINGPSEALVQSTDQDPLGETRFIVEGDKLQYGDRNDSASGGHDNKHTDGMEVTLPDAKSSEVGSVSTEPDEIDHSPSQKADSRPNSAMSSVDLGVGGQYVNLVNGEASPLSRTSPTTVASGDKKEHSTATRTQRRSRRRSYPEGSDTVEAYVSSEKVGMRARGNLVGRGPAPFNNIILDNTLGPSEAWVRTPRLKEEEEMHDKVATPPPAQSGASLLETSDNPLDLPGLETEYQERRRARTPSSERRSRREGVSHSRSSTPTFPSWQQRGRSQDIAVLIPEEETLLGTPASGTENPLSRENDEWEMYRRPERGLAGVIPPPERLETEELENTADGADASIEGESEDSARLREWRMSAAQAAFKNVSR